jgi:hypothetical protein
MKLLAISLLAFGAAAALEGATTIDNTNKFAYGANIGWINSQGDLTNGAVIGEYVLSGYIYGANVGWINLGDGTPVNNISYLNNSATDFGVNAVPSLTPCKINLRGFAYGANIGWINFENIGNPQVDLATGGLSGYAYGANVGWINLGQLGVIVETDSIKKGTDSDGDGIADAFELTYAGNLGTMTAATDHDGDGELDLDEYLEGTNPFDPNSKLQITSFVTNSNGSSSAIVWTSVTSRKYRVQKNPDLLSSWTTVLNNIVPSAGTTTSSGPLGDLAAGQRFFRVQAFSPLLVP